MLSSSSPDRRRMAERTTTTSTPDRADSPSSKETRAKNAPKGHHNRANNNSKPTLKSILAKPPGEWTDSNLKSLCNSIRHNRKGSPVESLRMMERILLELDERRSTGEDSAAAGTTTFLKPAHVFPLLASLSKEVRRQRRNKRSRRHQRTTRGGTDDANAIGDGDVRRLVSAVDLLRRLEGRDCGVDPGCYTEDVPSFATMIAAEASRWLPSAVDASLHFYELAEREEEGKDDGDDERDPRLVGAVLDALASVGRAEEAQALLGRAMGADVVAVTSDGDRDAATVVEPPVAAEKRRLLNPTRAGPCYDALLRAWSKRASLDKDPSSSAAKSSMDRARRILLDHMPLRTGVAITNRTCAAVLGGYASCGMSAEAERALMEIEALHLSPLYSKSSLDSSSSSTSDAQFASSLDVVCYNAVLHAHSQSGDPGAVARAGRLFAAMRERTPLTVTLKDSAVVDAAEEEDGAASFSVVPPEPDLVSHSSALNCYSRHGAIATAESLLDEMHDSRSFVPNAACYLPVIEALGKSDYDAASDARDACARALKWAERARETLRRPSRLLYVAALRCARRHGRGEEAEAALDRFRDAFEERGGRGGPDVYSYMLVLRAWERTRKKGDRRAAAGRARVLLDNMEGKVEEGTLPRLNVETYNVLLNCYARAGMANEADDLLAALEGGKCGPSSDDAVRPNGKSYSMAIKALANSDADDAVDRAWEVLRRLGYPKKTKTPAPRRSSPPTAEGETATGDDDDVVPFNVAIGNLDSMLKLLAKRGMASEAESLLDEIDGLVAEGTLRREGPDDVVRSHEAVLEALGRCGDADAPARAEALVTRLEVLSEMGGGGGEEGPSLLAYNSLLNCYANAGERGEAGSLLFFSLSRRGILARSAWCFLEETSVARMARNRRIYDSSAAARKTTWLAIARWVPCERHDEQLVLRRAALEEFIRLPGPFSRAMLRL